MEILGVLGCGFGPDYGQVIPLILGTLVLVVAVVVAGLIVAMHRGRARRRTESARQLVHAALLRAPGTPGRDRHSW
jgi:hypothetical protein